MRLLIVLPLIIIFFLPVQAEGFPEQKQIIVVFRYDDYSSLSSTELEIKIIHAFREYKIPCTVGVIPFTVANQLDTSPQNVFPLSEAKTALLKTAMKDVIAEVAQHGYYHQTLYGKKMYSEFYGLDYDSQLRKIQKGKNFLEKSLHTEITTFIPPFNTYDLNTIRALERLGFNCISSSVDGDATEVSRIHFLPETCSLLQLQDAVKTARNVHDPQPIIVVMFHEYDFVEIDKVRGTFTYQQFLDTLNWLTSQKDIQAMTVRKANYIRSDLTAKKFLLNHAAKFSLHFMPLFLRSSGLNNSGLYLSSSDCLETRAKNRIHTVLFYLAIVLISLTISFFSSFFIFLRSGCWISALRYGVLSLLVFCTIYAFRHLNPGYKGAIVLTVLFGTSIGVWSSYFILKMHGRLKQRCK